MNKGISVIQIIDNPYDSKEDLGYRVIIQFWGKEQKEKADQYREQILNNQAIVNELKEFYDEQTKFELEDDYDSLEDACKAGTDNAWWLLSLKRIIEKTKHSGSKNQ